MLAHLFLHVHCCNENWGTRDLARVHFERYKMFERCLSTQWITITNENDCFFQSMNLKEACKHALTILKQVMEEKLNETNVEVR